MILLMDQLCGQTDENEVSRYDFAQEIFKVTQKEITIIPCSSEEFITKAKRLKFSKLKWGNLENRKKSIAEYLNESFKK